MLPVTFTNRFRSPLATRWGLDPFDGLDRLATDFLSRTDSMPAAVDVREDNDNFYIDMDLPGMSRDDVDVTFENGILTISGERKSEQTREGENYHVTERRMGSFYRSFRVSDAIKEDNVEATLTNGVLTVKLTKADEVKPRRIEVKIG